MIDISVSWIIPIIENIVWGACLVVSVFIGGFCIREGISREIDQPLGFRILCITSGLVVIGIPLGISLAAIGIIRFV